MITVGGQLLICDGDEGLGDIPNSDQSRAFERCTLRAGVMRVQGERIEGIDWGEVPGSVDIGGPDVIICPGFVDTHLHLPQFDSIGNHGMPLLAWLEKVIFPAELRWNDVSFAKAMIERVIQQCLAVGTLAVGAYATSAHVAAVEAMRAFSDAGFGGVVGQVMMDCGAPAELLRPTSQLCQEVVESLNRFPASGRLAAAVTPRFALACTDELMQAAGDIAAGHQCVIQTHLAETIPECDAVRELHGDRYVSVYRRHGLLGPRSVLGHGIYLDDFDRQQLADTNTTIAHCPTANTFLRSGVMNLAAHRDRDVPFALGSDIGAGYERSMVRVGRAAIEAASQIANQAPRSVRSTPVIPEPSEMWYQITTGNANTLGLRDSGRLKIGCSADFLVISPRNGWQQASDPLAMLMFSWDDRWIEQVHLRGKRVMNCFPSESRG